MAATDGRRAWGGRAGSGDCAGTDAAVAGCGAALATVNQRLSGVGDP